MATGTEFSMEALHRRFLSISHSQWEAFAERQQQPRRTLEAQFPAQQAPEETALFRNETKPPLAVGRHSQTGAANVPLAHLQSLVPNDHSCFLCLRPGEREVVSGFQALGLPPLKDVRKI